MLGISAYFFVVIWHGRSCQEMCGTILWVGEKNDSTTLQSIYSMHWWPSFQRRRFEFRARKLNVCSQMFGNVGTWHVLEDLTFNGQWTNLHDRSQNGQKLVTNDYLVWSLTFIKHVNTNSIVMWETLPNNADWDCFETPILQEILKIQNPLLEDHCAFFGNHTFVPISWMCKKQTSVSHSSTESEIISLDAGLRLDGIHALDLWDLIIAVLHGNTYQSDQERGDPCTNLVRAAPHGMIDDLDNADFYFLKRQFFSRSFVVCEGRQRNSDQHDHKGKKSDHETCFQNPQSCSWVVVRSNQSGRQNPNQVHRHQKPTRRHTDKGKFHTWWMESSFVFVQHQPFQIHRLSWSDVEKNAKRCRWRKSHSKIKANDEFVLAIKGSKRACLHCIRKPGENQVWESNTSELMNWAASKNGETCEGRLLIKLLRMECWRKVVFSRVEIWWSDGSKNGETC